MSIVYKLTWRHLRMNRSRTLITIIGITLSVAMVCAVAGLVNSYFDLAHRTFLEEMDSVGVMSEETRIALLWVAVILIGIIGSGSVIVIANAFHISVSDRTRQFGLLKSVGATNGQIARGVFFEAFILLTISIPLGIAAGYLLQGTLLLTANRVLAEVTLTESRYLHMVFPPKIPVISAGVTILTVLISAWRPAWRTARMPVIDAIRQTKDIYVSAYELRVSRLTQKLFGFEGTLAAKSLKRSREKYRTAVISLVASIVLLVGISSLVGMLNLSNAIYMDSEPYDVEIRTDGNVVLQDEVKAYLSDIPNITFQTKQTVLANTIFPENFYTPKFQSYYFTRYKRIPDTHTNIELFSIPDEEYKKIADADNISAILVNSWGVVWIGGERTSIEPFDYRPGMSHSIDLFMEEDGAGSSDSLSIDDEIGAFPQSLELFQIWRGYPRALIPESTYRRIAADNGRSGADFRVVVEDADAFYEEAVRRFPYPDVVVINNREYIRSQRGTTLSIALFGYSFIFMLSLIASTSVMATISTSMALRRQEFAMLCSVGMTNKELNRMLNLESLLYSLKSLIIGIPLGVGVSYAFFSAIRDEVEFSYALPWMAIIISASAVLLLTFASMRYGKRKLRGMNIIEVLRGEVF